jgi:hypothetical protein
MGEDIFSRLLDTNGDGTGVKELTVLPVTSDFPEDRVFLQPAAGEILEVTRLLVQVRASGSPVSAERYGDQTALTGGITIQKSGKRGVIADLTDGLTIKNNGDWGRVCYDVNSTGFVSGDQFVHVRWTFKKHGKSVILDGDRLERLEVVFVAGDDFSGLASHTFTAQGNFKKGGS